MEAFIKDAIAVANIAGQRGPNNETSHPSVFMSDTQGIVSHLSKTPHHKIPHIREFTNKNTIVIK